jgi:exodeoxyribonuclease VII small subunit
MSKKEAGSPDVAQQPSFEDALGKLEQVVRRLEEGEIGLNEALVTYEQGVKLLRHCYQLLEGAERRIELLSGVDAEGKPVVEAIDDAVLSLEEKAQRRGRRRTSAEDPPRSKEPKFGVEDTDIDDPRGLF